MAPSKSSCQTQLSRVPTQPWPHAMPDSSSAAGEVGLLIESTSRGLEKRKSRGEMVVVVQMHTGGPFEAANFTRTRVSLGGCGGTPLRFAPPGSSSRRPAAGCIYLTAAAVAEPEASKSYSGSSGKTTSTIILLPASIT